MLSSFSRKGILYNDSSVFNREFPSDEDCYSSDYESYESDDENSSDNEDKVGINGNESDDEQSGMLSLSG